jgi:predicted RND superfamily exporter protein
LVIYPSFSGGIGLLFLSSSIFLSLPRILGKLIDSMDETKTQNEKEDVLSKAAKFFKNNLIALAAVVLVAAFALGGRIYCMHTASQFYFNLNSYHK